MSNSPDSLTRKNEVTLGHGQFVVSHGPPPPARRCPQAGHYVAALIRAFQLTEGASAAASATVPPRGEPPPEGGREVGPRQEAGRAASGLAAGEAVP